MGAKLDRIVTEAMPYVCLIVLLLLLAAWIGWIHLA